MAQLRKNTLEVVQPFLDLQKRVKQKSPTVGVTALDDAQGGTQEDKVGLQREIVRQFLAVPLEFMAMDPALFNDSNDNPPPFLDTDLFADCSWQELTQREGHCDHMPS
jgi:hypothetical protein